VVVETKEKGAVGRERVRIEKVLSFIGRPKKASGYYSAFDNIITSDSRCGGVWEVVSQ
jgi:hypothetical protein